MICEELLAGDWTITDSQLTTACPNQRMVKLDFCEFSLMLTTADKCGCCSPIVLVIRSCCSAVELANKI